MALLGKIEIGGDKSISHRLVMICSLINDVSVIENLSKCTDVVSTIKCLKECNVSFKSDQNKVIIKGGALRQPNVTLDVGNSGTTARMLMGLFCGQGIKAKLTGDASILKRPMKRIIQPLVLMGSKILSSGYLLPVEINSGINQAIVYKNKTKSAQVKSSLIFAGIGSENYSTISFDKNTRDHTENILQFIEADIKINKDIMVRKSLFKKGLNFIVPGDISNASFIIAGAAIIPGSQIKISNLLYNNTRMGFINTLIKMGAYITVDNIRTSFCEKTCDITASYSPKLKGVKISGDDLLVMIDEIPIFSVVAAIAKGKTVISGARELRFKESDRLNAIYNNLSAMGANIIQKEDGLEIFGGDKLYNANINTFGDHRILMAFEIMHLYLNNKLLKEDKDLSKISFPEFYKSVEVLLNG